MIPVLGAGFSPQRNWRNTAWDTGKGISLSFVIISRVATMARILVYKLTVGELISFLRLPIVRFSPLYWEFGLRSSPRRDGSICRSKRRDVHYWSLRTLLHYRSIVGKFEITFSTRSICISNDPDRVRFGHIHQSQATNFPEVKAAFMKPIKFWGGNTRESEFCKA